MQSTAVTSANQQIRSIATGPRLFLSVVVWEFQRYRASRLFWYQALGLFAFMLLVTWALHAPEHIGGGVNSGGSSVQLSGFVAGTSRTAGTAACRRL